MLRTLWPEPAEITVISRRERPRPGGTEFLVLPNVQHPKLLLPRRPLGATAGSLRNYKTSATSLTLMKVRALSLAARVGLGEVLPHRIRIEEAPSRPRAGIDSYLAEALGRDLLVGMYIGPTRAVQKPILQLLTPQGETVAFVKIGVSSLTRSLVSGEARALRLLSTLPRTRLVVPQVLHHGQWRDHEVLVQQAMMGSGRGSTNQKDVSSASVELAGLCGIDVHPLTASPYWQRLRGTIASLPASRHAHRLTALLDVLEGTCGAVDLPFGSWHGDWTPWNLTSAGHRVVAWDWEQFDTGVPMGFDALHYRVQDDVVCKGLAPDAALLKVEREAPELLGAFGVQTELAKLVFALYIVEIAARYLHDGEMEAGTRMGSLDWLEPLLARHTVALDPAVQP
jgi:hypothetical protein